MLPTNFMPRFFKSFEMASNLSVCPLHSLLRLQEKNDRPDTVRTRKHTNRIIIEPSAGRLYRLTFGQSPNHGADDLPSSTTHPIRRIDAIAVQHLTFLMKRTHFQIRNRILFCQLLIVFRAQHGDFNLFMHSYSHFESAPKSSYLARLPESRQQLIQPPVQSEGLLFDIVRNVDLT